MRTPGRSRRPPRRRTAGFSIIEALVAAGVLGIALTALVKLHQTSMRGTVASHRLGSASEVARGLADQFAPRVNDIPLGCAPGQGAALAALPQCPAVLGAGAAGVCSSPDTCSALNACVFDVDINGDNTPPPAGPPLPGRYRVQVLESQNPAGGIGVRVSVVVCWNDTDSTSLRRVTTDRLAIPGL